MGSQLHFRTPFAVAAILALAFSQAVGPDRNPPARTQAASAAKPSPCGPAVGAVKNACAEPASTGTQRLAPGRRAG